MQRVAEDDPAAAAIAAEMLESSATVEVDPAFEWIWRAWHRLSLDRPLVSVGLSGVMPQRIPWTTLVRWCEWHGHGGEDLELLDHCVVGLDRIFVEWCRDRMRANQK